MVHSAPFFLFPEPKQLVSGFRIGKTNKGEEMVYADNVTLIWDAVDESEQETQGFFRGYVVSGHFLLILCRDEIY